MRKNLRWKAILIVAVVGLFGWSMHPVGERIKLGLDLSGGIHLIMKVNMEDALNAVTDETIEALAELLDEEVMAFE